MGLIFTVLIKSSKLCNLDFFLNQFPIPASSCTQGCWRLWHLVKGQRQSDTSGPAARSLQGHVEAKKDLDDGSRLIQDASSVLNSTEEVHSPSFNMLYLQMTWTNEFSCFT